MVAVSVVIFIPSLKRIMPWRRQASHRFDSAFQFICDRPRQERSRFRLRLTMPRFIHGQC
jgi:hypothetical protein